MKNVVDAQETYGVYDIVARIESDSKYQLENIISEQIRKMENVDSTLTLIPRDLNYELTDLIPDIIPDVIPEEKITQDEESSEVEDDFIDEEYENFKSKKSGRR